MPAILDVPLYPVLVLDNDKTTFKQAFDAVYTVFSLSTEKANAVVHEISENGYSIIGSFTKEIADSYIDEMTRYTEAFGFTLDAEIDYSEFETILIDEVESEDSDDNE